MNRPMVDILMAVYDGEHYLPQQLDSLLKQTYPFWQLVIHDDGSTDNTRSIIEQYQLKDSRIMLLDDGITGLGAAYNFLHLLTYSTAEFCMFCDQDDIWFPNKIERMIEHMGRIDGAGLVYSNAYFYKGGMTIEKKTTTFHPSNLKDTLFLNAGIQGCSMMVNRQLIDLLKPFPTMVAMHDHLLTVGAATFGKINYLDDVLMLYRQHDLNATGNQQLRVYAKVKSFLFHGKPVIDRTHLEANEAFYDRYSALMSKEAKQSFESYFSYAHCLSVFKRLHIVLGNGFRLGNKRGILLLKTLLRKPVDGMT